MSPKHLLDEIPAHMLMDVFDPRGCVIDIRCVFGMTDWDCSGILVRHFV